MKKFLPILWIFFTAPLCWGEMPLWVFKTLSGEVMTSPSWSIEENVYQLGEKKIPVSQVYSLEQAGSVRPVWPTSAVLVTLAGDRLAGELVSGKDTSLIWKANWGDRHSELSFPMSGLAYIRWQNRESSQSPEPIKGRDVVRLTSDEDLTGALSGLTPKEGITLEEMGKKKTIPIEKVQWVVFNPDLARPRLPRGAYYRITTQNGNRLIVTQFTSNGKELTAENLFRQKVVLNQALVVAIDEMAGQALDLASIKPNEFVYSSFDDEKFVYKVNQNVLGQPLCLKNGERIASYDSGLGLHSGMLLKYSLEGKYKRFEGKIGLDAVSGLRGEVLVTMQLDGKPIEGWTNRKLTIRDEGVDFSIDTNGKKELVIEFKRGSLGPVQGVVNLVQARLIP